MTKYILIRQKEGKEFEERLKLLKSQTKIKDSESTEGVQ